MNTTKSEDITNILSVSIFIIIFIIFKMMNEQPAADLLSVLTASLCIHSYTKYQEQRKSKFLLINTILYGIITIGLIIYYIYSNLI